MTAYRPHIPTRGWRHPRCLLALCLLLGSGAIRAHGGVLLEEDVCVINVGFFKSHFTVYQPETRGSREFCEDLPDAAKTVFVLEYLHDSLRRLPVEFRIIRDATGLGRYARWEDVAALGPLEPLTVFHQPPTRYSDGMLTVEHDFTEAGPYIGIVTTRQPGHDKIYRAVFPFQVGWAGPGYWPLLAAIALAFGGYVVFSNRRLRRRGKAA